MYALTGAVVGAIAGAVAVGKVQKESVSTSSQYSDRYRDYYSMLIHWLGLKQEGKSLDQYFVNNNYKKVAIYGMGEMGSRLYEELKNSDKIEVAYAIDQNADNLYSELEIIKKEDDYPEADVIVVTATYAFDDIAESVSEKVDYKIVSLEDVIYEA